MKLSPNWIRDFVDLTWTSTLQQRLSLLSHSANPPFITANVSREEAFDRASYACVNVAMRDQNWQDAVRSAEQWCPARRRGC